jgi:acetoin utilization protein AcuC
MYPNPSTVGAINLLPEAEKNTIYARLIPRELMDRLHIPAGFMDRSGNSLLDIKAASGSTDVDMRLYHQVGFPDPVLYGHLTDTMNGQIHILLYILNDPDSPRFDVDRMPDGSLTKFGTLQRNLQAEEAALLAGLAPGQTRRGLRLLRPAITAFEEFVMSLDHDIYFTEPLYYHNAIIFERYGFAYQVGKKLMESIQAGFSEGGDLCLKLDGSTPFRQPGAAESIRLRSWAIHDGLLGEPFTRVTMYKRVGKIAGVSTCEGCAW